MKERIFIYLLVIMLLGNAAYAKSDLTKAGDVLQLAIPISAFGVAAYKNDKEGQVEFAKSFLTTMAVTYAAKYSLKNSSWSKRPGGGDYSFPSGHTSSAFGGAFFLQQRYGVEYGAPAIALATLTGVSRITGEYHHWRDVIGSTLIAAGANYFLVSKYNKNDLSVSANIDHKTAILNLSLKF